MIYQINAWDYIKTLPDQSIDHIITDPVYDEDLDIAELRRVTRGNIIAFCKPENQFFKPDEYAFWVKPTSTKNFSKHLGRFVEMILISRGNTFNKGLHWSQYVGIYNDTVEGVPVHPWQKPYSLMERLVLIYSNPRDLILDPFAGSGTTLLAALRNNRRFAGCETESQYVAITKNRLENFKV